MDPTLADGEWLFVNKCDYLMSGAASRGYRHLGKSARRQGEISRQTNRRRSRGHDRDMDGQLYRNGERVDEPYTDSQIEDGDWGPGWCPKERISSWGTIAAAAKAMTAEIRMNRLDSQELIKGKADFILWPFGKIGDIIEGAVMDVY